MGNVEKTSKLYGGDYIAMTSHTFIFACPTGLSCSFTVDPSGIAKLSPKERGKALNALWSRMQDFHGHVPKSFRLEYTEWQHDLYDFALSGLKAFKV